MAQVLAFSDWVSYGVGKRYGGGDEISDDDEDETRGGELSSSRPSKALLPLVEAMALCKWIYD
jgi:hypothetical protein